MPRHVETFIGDDLVEGGRGGLPERISGCDKKMFFQLKLRNATLGREMEIAAVKETYLISCTAQRRPHAIFQHSFKCFVVFANFFPPFQPSSLSNKTKRVGFLLPSSSPAPHHSRVAWELTLPYSTCLEEETN